MGISGDRQELQHKHSWPLLDSYRPSSSESEKSPYRRHNSAPSRYGGDVHGIGYRYRLQPSHSQRHPTHSRRDSQQGHARGGGLRASDVRHSRAAYQQGVVFSAVSHAQSTVAPDAPAAGDNVSTTPRGAVYSKYRKYIVIGRYEKHCQAIPIYTHGGRGLRDLRCKEEAVSVRDSGGGGAAAGLHPERAESAHGVLYAMRDPDFPARKTFIAGKSSAQLTEVCSHRYEWRATIEGRLGAWSTAKLLRLLGRERENSLTESRYDTDDGEGGGGSRTSEATTSDSSRSSSSGWSLSARSSSVEPIPTDSALEEGEIYEN